MQLDAMSVVLRPRSVWEGCDLGVRLLQSSSRSVYRCYLVVAVPLFALFLACTAWGDWVAPLLIWLSKPWLDRTILFVLSRALLGQPTRWADLTAAARSVWGADWLRTLTLARLSASRSFTAPVVQLEGLHGAARRERLKVLANRGRGVARAMTQAFATAELAVLTSLLILPAWLAPHSGQGALDVASWTRTGPLMSGLAYAATVCFLEPFYVAAGFGMYLNRRVELEAWDIEQEFRRAFAA
jgi:hypothetical protein